MKELYKKACNNEKIYGDCYDLAFFILCRSRVKKDGKKAKQYF
ncbi:hypothetical protein [Campylobacter blaseri]|nr:hypothetical protein [Campylobacter blaseri]